MAGSSTKQAGAPRWSALQRWTLGVTSTAAFMAGMDGLVVTTALPTIHADLGTATSLTAGIGGLVLASPTHQRHGVGGSVHAVNRRPKAARIIHPSRVSLA